MDPAGNLKFHPGQFADGLLAAHNAGAVDGAKFKELYGKAVDADKAFGEQQALQARVGADGFAKAKAVATGLTRGGAFLAGAIPAGEAGAALAAPTAPFTFGLGPVVAGGISALAGGFLAEHAASAVGNELAKHSDTIKSFADASKALPGYDAAGNLISMVVPGVAGAANLARVTGIRAAEAGLPAALKLGAKELAAGAAGGVAFESTIRPTFDYALKASGIGDPNQSVAPTAKSIAAAGLLGSLLPQLGIKFKGYDEGAMADIFSRAAGGKELTPAEQEVYANASAKVQAVQANTGPGESFSDVLARLDAGTLNAQPSTSTTATGTQALRRGQPIGVVTSEVAGGPAAGGAPGATGGIPPVVPPVIPGVSEPPQSGGPNPTADPGVAPQAELQNTAGPRPAVEPVIPGVDGETPASGGSGTSSPTSEPAKASQAETVESPAGDSSTAAPKTGTATATDEGGKSTYETFAPEAKEGGGDAPVNPELGDTITTQGGQKLTVTGGDADTITAHPQGNPELTAHYSRSAIAAGLASGQSKLEKGERGEKPTAASVQGVAPANRPDQPPVESESLSTGKSATSEPSRNPSSSTDQTTHEPNTQAPGPLQPAAASEALAAQASGTATDPGPGRDQPAASGTAGERSPVVQDGSNAPAAAGERAPAIPGVESPSTTPSNAPTTTAEKEAAPAKQDGAKLAGDQQRDQPGQRATGPDAASPVTVEHARQHLTDAQTAHAPEIAHLGATFEDTPGTADHTGISLAPTGEPTIHHNPPAFARSAEAVRQAGGDAKTWANSAVQEELIHHRDVKASGDQFDSIHSRIYSALPKEARAAIAQVYPDNRNPVILAAEYVRALAQHRAGSPITESHFRDTKPLEAILAGPQPQAVEDHLAKMQALSPSAEAPSTSPTPKEARGTLAGPSEGPTQNAPLASQDRAERSPSDVRPASSPSAQETPATPFRQGDSAIYKGRAATINEIEGGRATITLRPTPTMKSKLVHVGVGDLKPKPVRTFTLPDAPQGSADVIDHIINEGGIIGKGEAQKRAASKGLPLSADYNDLPNLSGIYQSKVFGGTEEPNVMAKTLHDSYGVGDGSTGSMYAAIDQAMRTRKSVRAESVKQAKAEQQSANFQRDAETPGKKKKEIHAGNLNVGDTVKVGDQTLKVIDVDPDSEDVTLEDHAKYGVQTVGPAGVLYVEQVRRAKGSSDFAPSEDQPSPTTSHQSSPATPPRPESSAAATAPNQQRSPEKLLPSVQSKSPVPSPKPTQPAPKVETANTLKTRLDLILDGVEKHGEVSLHLDRPMSREEVRRVADAATARGMTAAYDGHGFLIRKTIAGEYTPPAKPAPLPQLRTGEKGTADLFQGEDQPFNLSGETGTDGERIVAAKAKAEKDAAEAKAKQDREQLDFTKPTSPKISDAASKALDDAFNGLFAANPALATPSLAQEELPPDKIGPFVAAAQALISSGIDTPEAMARVLDDKFQGKARKYSEALWDAFGMAKKALRGSYDWGSIYGALDAAQQPATVNQSESGVEGRTPRGEALVRVQPLADKPSPSNDRNRRPNLEPDRQDTGLGERGSADQLPVRPGSTDKAGERVDAAGEVREDGPASSAMSADVPSVPHREPSDPIVRESASAAPQRAARDERPAGSRGPDDSGLPSESAGPEKSSLDLDGPSAVAQTLAASGEDRLDAGAASGWHPVLTPEQVADGQFVERRLLENGKPGVMLTNGTGTGKTFSGLGAIKRRIDAGENNILIVVPSDKIGSDWVKAAKEQFGIPDVAQLESTKDNGQEYRLVVTTFANMGQNPSLVQRPWGLVTVDEAQYLSSSQEGKSTAALDTFRALTFHRQGGLRRAEMMEPEATATLQRFAQMIRDGQKLSEPQLDEQQAAHDKIKAARAQFDKERTQRGEAGRPKALMLSATPFAYHFSLDYGEGYLFDHGPEPTNRGYNTPSARGQFYMDNFGYRMRTGKLTQPENATATGILERRFAEKLMKDGAMAGRSLQVPFDYSRQFVLTESQLGGKIDEVMKALEGDKELGALKPYLPVGDYLSRRYLLEALKARDSIPRIKEHLALGRKAVVFYDYNKGGATNPLRPMFTPGQKETISTPDGPQVVDLSSAYRKLAAKVSGFDDVVNQLDALESPIELFKREFPTAGIFNGKVSKAERRRIVDAFNKSGGEMNVMLVQRASGKEGISLQDRDGQHQRVLIDLGIPAKPTDAIQTEGRINRHGMQSNGIMEYLTTGTDFERWTFAQTIAQRASTAENLAMGERARSLLQSFASGYNDAEASKPGTDQGTGGKQQDAALENGDPYKNAVALYYTNAKKTSRNKSQEGVDYFPTPEPLAFKMVEWAGIKPGEKVLEPSAGHGAIARFFPDSTNRHAVEPSNELLSRLALNAPDTELHQQRFEDFNIVNKFDAVVMNPPFGTGGRTAVDHIIKAAQHLREGGRIVALLPEGSATQKFEKWYDDAPGIYMSAEFGLPPVTFERAGTAVRARVVVLDKVAKPENAPQEQGRRDIGGDSITEFFDALANQSVPDRQTGSQDALPSPAVPSDESTEDETSPKQSQPRSTPGQPTARQNTERQENRSGPSPTSTIPTPTRDSNFSPADFLHTKSRVPVFVARPARRFSTDEFRENSARAKELRGHYSSFKGAGAIPGFHFKTAEERDQFIGTDGPTLRVANPLAIPQDSRAQVAEKGDDYKELRASNATVVGPATFTLRAANPITALHASPHEVSEFSLEHVGSGEGNQVYGYGLYFAESEEVSGIGGAYHQMFRKRVTSGTDARAVAARLLHDSKLTPEQVVAELNTRANGSNDPEFKAKMQEAVQHVQRGTADAFSYTVHLDADPDELLDWDKRLKDQSPKVKAGLEKIGVKPEALAGFKITTTPSGKTFYITRGGFEYGTRTKSRENAEKQLQQLEMSYAYSGGTLYLENGYGTKAAKEMSGKLLAAGIPGIRYLDADSRSEATVHPFGTRWAVQDKPQSKFVGEFSTKEEATKAAEDYNAKRKQTSNYVMFDDSRIKITHRNGQPVTMEQAASDAPALYAANPMQSFKEVQEQIADEYASLDQKDQIKSGYDSANNTAEYRGEQAGNKIRLDFVRPHPADEARAARKAREAEQAKDADAMPYVIEAGHKAANLAVMRQKIATSSDPQLAKDMLPGIDHAIANFARLNPLRLVNHDTIMAAQHAKLKAADVTVGEVENYVTRKLDQPESVKETLPNPLFSMGGGQAGGARYFTKGRSFETLADAIHAGYRPKSTNLAELDRHRITAGERILEQKAFINRLKATPSPTDGQPIVGKFGTRTTLSGATEQTTPPGYTSVQTSAGPQAIHNQFAHLFKDLYGDSAARRLTLFRGIMKAAAITKQYTLLLDTFHIGRLLYKMAVAGGGAPVTFKNGKPEWNIRHGLALIEYDDADLGRAVAAGEISQSDADYARTMRQQAEELLANGLNVGRVADNLVQQAHVHVPGLQGFNDWIFGKLSRAAMIQTALTGFERNLKNFPERSRVENARQTAKEMNELFGNLQNQGLFTNKTFQDIARLIFLAPQWTESQLRYEGRAYGQIGRGIYDGIRGGGGGKPPTPPPGGWPGGVAPTPPPGGWPTGKRFRLGNSARAFAVGLTALLAANQVINYLSRGQSTFQNEEDDHKLDAFIPGGKRGFWFNPFEIAGEYAHAAFKYAAQHENPVDIASHVVSNKLSPIARGAKDILTGRDYSGKHYLDNGDRFTAGIVDALPSPIPLGGVLEKDPRRALGYRANRQPGSVEKQLLASVGLKTSNAQSPRSQMFALAQPFRADRGGNDAAGEFSELRRALDNDDQASSQSEIQWLLERGKSMAGIERAVGISRSTKPGGGISVRPEQFAGSADAERQFVASLTPEQSKVYQQAQNDHRENAQKLLTYSANLLRDDPDARKLAAINAASDKARVDRNKAAKAPAPVAPKPVAERPAPVFGGF